MVCIYPIGCPLLLLVMLFRFKDLLHPPGREGEEEAVVAERKESAELNASPITAFALPYRPPYWVSFGVTYLCMLLLISLQRAATLPYYIATLHLPYPTAPPHP